MSWWHFYITSILKNALVSLTQNLLIFPSVVYSHPLVMFTRREQFDIQEKGFGLNPVGWGLTGALPNGSLWLCALLKVFLQCQVSSWLFFTFRNKWNSFNSADVKQTWSFRAVLFTWFGLRILVKIQTMWTSFFEFILNHLLFICVSSGKEELYWYLSEKSINNIHLSNFVLHCGRSGVHHNMLVLWCTLLIERSHTPCNISRRHRINDLLRLMIP